MSTTSLKPYDYNELFGVWSLCSLWSSLHYSCRVFGVFTRLYE